MGRKHEWKIDRNVVHNGFFHEYDGAKHVGAEFKVILSVRLANDPTRDVYQTMTADEADALADMLRTHAENVRRKNDDKTRALAETVWEGDRAPGLDDNDEQTERDVIEHDHAIGH